MAEQPDRDALITAMTTEHFVMQSAIGTSVSEQQGRASMFLYAVSGTLVAIGFMAQSEHFLLFVAAALPVLFLSGLLTILRLVDIGMESLQSHVTIARIRGYYRSLGHGGAAQFDKAHGRWPDGKSDSGYIIGPVLGLLTTAASMIAVVNAFIGAALLALLMVKLLHVDLAIAIGAGIAFAAAQVVAAYVYQDRRIDMVIKLAESSGTIIGGD